MLKKIIATATAAAAIAIPAGRFLVVPVTVEYVASPIHVQAEELPLPAPEPVVVATSTIQEKIASYAAKYDVSRDLMTSIIRCETAGTFDPKIQSSARYTRDHPDWGVKQGDRELSFGLVQIHRPAHPHVTYEQATDPDFALDFMAKNLAAGRRSMWTC